MVASPVTAVRATTLFTVTVIEALENAPRESKSVTVSTKVPTWVPSTRTTPVTESIVIPAVLESIVK